MNRMNDLEFRQKLFQNPKQLSEEMRAYLEAHPEQKPLVSGLLKLEDQLQQVLEVTPPDDLQARILMRNTFAKEAAPKAVEPVVELSAWQRISTFGASFAASFVVLAMVVWFWQTPLNEGRVVPNTTQASYLTADVVSHIIKHAQEAPEIMTDYTSMEEEQLQALFAKVGATLHKPIDFMSFAGECDVEGQKGLHLVLQEEAGPVTIIVIPGQKMTAMQAFQNSGFEGQMIPVNGAVVAIVGHSYEQLARAQMHFFKAVDFG